jgi:hypothetical protein
MKSMRRFNSLVNLLHQKPTGSQLKPAQERSGTWGPKDQQTSEVHFGDGIDSPAEVALLPNVDAIAIQLLAAKAEGGLSDSRTKIRMQGRVTDLRSGAQEPISFEKYPDSRFSNSYFVKADYGGNGTNLWGAIEEKDGEVNPYERQRYRLNGQPEGAAHTSFLKEPNPFLGEGQETSGYMTAYRYQTSANPRSKGPEGQTIFGGVFTSLEGPCTEFNQTLFAGSDGLELRGTFGEESITGRVFKDSEGYILVERTIGKKYKIEQRYSAELLPESV